jgi:hypothetical protein
MYGVESKDIRSGTHYTKCRPDSGNMLILVLAHAQSSGDGSLIGKYVGVVLFYVSVT